MPVKPPPNPSCPEGEGREIANLTLYDFNVDKWLNRESFVTSCIDHDSLEQVDDSA
jgi:hypothetical protein